MKKIEIVVVCLIILGVSSCTGGKSAVNTGSSTSSSDNPTTINNEAANDAEQKKVESGATIYNPKAPASLKNEGNIKAPVKKYPSSGN